MIKMAGGVPVLVVAGEEQGFKATGEQIKAAITDKTKCVIINNPSNPTGALYSKEELQEIADICVENDLYIISDEIYYQLIYDNAEFVSIASLGKDVYDHTIIINGVSKCYDRLAYRVCCGKQRDRKDHVQLSEPFHRCSVHYQPVGFHRGAERSPGRN